MPLGLALFVDRDHENVMPWHADLGVGADQAPDVFVGDLLPGGTRRCDTSPVVSEHRVAGTGC